MTRYTTLSLAEVRAELAAVTAQTEALFGALDADQLNWRADAATWSVAQCFEHLTTANREIFQSIEPTLSAPRPWTIWQRLPLLPRLFGRLLIRSQQPDATRKFVAPAKATPSASAIDSRVIERFLASQHDADVRMRALDDAALDRVMVSPFVAFIAYSVRDACRLVAAHERRHFEQAVRVTRQPGFPRSA